MFNNWCFCNLYVNWYKFGINVKRVYRFLVNFFMFSILNWSVFSSLSYLIFYFGVGLNKSDCSFRISVCIGN